VRVLVTGFEPFGGERLNAGWEAVRRLPAVLGDAQVVTVQIPTVFGRAGAAARAAIAEHRPDAVVNVGEAGGAAAVRVERVAINLDDARIADNDGDQPVD